MTNTTLDELAKERLFKRIDHVRAHVPLVRVMVDLGAVHQEIARAGEFQMKCPFHGQDNKPSAHVYSDGRFHCFTCKRHYNVIHFVQNYKNMTFGQAMKWLEVGYGVPKLDFTDEDLPLELDPKREIKMGAEKVHTIPYEEVYRQLEKKIMRGKRQLGLETYARAFLALDLTKEAKNIEQLAVLEQKIDAKLQVQP